MKQSTDEAILQTNLLQAFQKNKIIQGKLSERQRIHYVQLVKEMQDHNLKEKLNRELLYTWKKESYVRQLKKNLEEYRRKRFGVQDAYYDYQTRNLESIVAGQQGLVIPPKEEENRLNVNTKLNVFLAEHPARVSSSIRPFGSRKVPALPTTTTDNKIKEDEIDTEAVEKTWQEIHALSAIGLRRGNRVDLPMLKRSFTMDEFRRNNGLPKNPLVASVAIISSVFTPTKVDSTPSPNNDEQKLSLSVPLLPEGLEPISISSETLAKQTGADLINMKSVRRPRKNIIDLNMAFEARKRIYRINKHVFDQPSCHKKCSLKFNSAFDRAEFKDPADDEEIGLIELNEIARRRYEDRHQADKSFV